MKQRRIRRVVRDEDRDLQERIKQIRVEEFEEGYARGARRVKEVLNNRHLVQLDEIRTNATTNLSGLLARVEWLEHLLYTKGTSDQQRDYLALRHQVHEMPEELVGVVDDTFLCYRPEHNWSTYITYMRKHACHFQKVNSSDDRVATWRLFSVPSQHVEGSCLEEVLDEAIKFAKLRGTL